MENGGSSEQDNDEQRQHKPRHLAKGHGERELKVVDGIDNFLHAPNAGVAFYFLHFSESVLSYFLTGNGSLFPDRRISLVA